MGQCVAKDQPQPKRNVQGKNDEDPIWKRFLKAAYKEDTEAIRTYLTSGLDPDISDNSGHTALLVACENGNLEIVKLLLEHKADASYDKLIDKGLQTPLLTATSKWQPKNESTLIVKLLLEANAGHSVAHKSGTTPMIWAARCGALEVVDLLILHNADVNLGDASGKNPLFCAVEKNQKEMVQKLLKTYAPKQVPFVESNEVLSIKQLSSGNFGITYTAELVLSRAMDEPVKLPVVCKVPRFGAAQDDWYELEVLKTVPNHPNVLSLLGMMMSFRFEGRNSLAILVSFKEGGSLKKLIEEQKEGLTLNMLAKLCLDMTNGVQHLHEHDYHHNDIALRNFLLQEVQNGAIMAANQRVILADFGLARPLKAINSDTGTPVRPWRWCAPETLKSHGHQTSIETDIYMLGVAFWELLGYKVLPFHFASSYSNLLKLIKPGKSLLHFDKNAPPRFTSLIEKCCSFEPENRITIPKIIEELRKFLDVKKNGQETETNADVNSENKHSESALDEVNIAEYDKSDVLEDETGEERAEDVEDAEDAEGDFVEGGYVDVDYEGLSNDASKENQYGGYVDVYTETPGARVEDPVYHSIEDVENKDDKETPLRDSTEFWRWLAPEQLKSEKIVSKESDAWQLGITLWQMVHVSSREVVPFHDFDSQSGLCDALDEESLQICPLHFGETVSPEWKALVLKCCTLEVDSRPSLEVISSMLKNLIRKHRSGFLRLSSGAESKHSEDDGSGSGSDVSENEEEEHVEKNATKYGSGQLLKSSANLKSSTKREGDHEKLLNILDALETDDLTKIEKLVEDGLDINEPVYCKTTLMYAAEKNVANIMKWLIDRKADVNTLSSLNMSALCYGVITRSYDAIQLLLEQDGIDVDIRDKDGNSALMLAAAKNDGAIVKILLDRNVDVSGSLEILYESKMVEETEIVKRKYSQKQKFYDASALTSIKQIGDPSNSRRYSANLCISKKHDELTIPVVCQLPTTNSSNNEWNELDVLQNVPFHPNIIGFAGLCMDFQHDGDAGSALLFAIRETGTLKTHLSQTEGLTLLNLAEMSLKMTNALSHIHEFGFAHNFVNLESFKMSRTGDAHADHNIVADIVLAEFGSSRRI